MATRASTHASPRLAVTDFGPIVEADVELRPLTVFVGPSNTGKSLLAVLIYALHQWLAVSGGPFRYGASWWRVAPGQQRTPAEQQRLRQAIGRWASEFEGRADRAGNVPQEVVEATRASLTQAKLAPLFVDELVRCFGVDDISQLIRQGTSQAGRLALRTSPSNRKDGLFEIAADLRKRGVDLHATIPQDVSVPDANELLAQLVRSVGTGGGNDDLFDAILECVAVALGSLCGGPFAKAAYYLPADRTGIMHAHRVVVGSLIHRSSRTGLREEAPLPVLSGVVADFLERLLETTPWHRGRTVNEPLASQLEEHLLDGTIKVQPSQTGYPSFVYRPDGWNRDLPLMNASSMVSEVAPVVLFLRYVVQPGDTLIVEEPESHLHPAMQVELTRHLAAAVQAGVRIVLTTHSEWVLEALANLVRLSGLPKAKRKGLPGAEYALSTKQVGAWMFKPKSRPRGSVVEELPLDVDAGTFPAGYGEITESLYNDWASITNRIETERHR